MKTILSFFYLSRSLCS